MVGGWMVKQFAGQYKIGGMIGIDYRMHYIYELESKSDGEKDFISGNNILIGPFARFAVQW